MEIIKSSQADLDHISEGLPVQLISDSACRVVDKHGKDLNIKMGNSQLGTAPHLRGGLGLVYPQCYIATSKLHREHS